MAEGTFERSLEIKAGNASAIPTLVKDWWKEISSQSDTVASPGKLYAIGNYLVQLVKNSLGGINVDGPASTRGDVRSSTRGGLITAIFDDEKIKIIIDDLGGGEKEISLNFKGDYGMKEAIEYFDIFTIESRGQKYEKNNRNMIEQTDESDTYAGSKVTIVKYHVTPVDEFEEEYRVKRGFSERM